MPTVSGSSRRAKGEGSWEVLPSGKTRLVKIQNGQKLTGPAAIGKVAARAAWEEKYAKPKGKSRLSLSTFAKTWVDDQSGSPTTLEQLRIFVESKIQDDPIGDIPIKSIDEPDVRAWLSRQKQADETVKRNLGRLKQILKAAGIAVDVTRPKKPDHKRRPLTPRERQELPTVLAAATEECRRAILIAYYTGARKSEILALRHSDRDGSGIWIRRRAVATRGRLDVQAQTKNSRSRRWIPLPPQLDWIGEGQGFVVTGTARPLSPHVLTKEFRSAIAGTSWEKVPYCGFHTLRRTYAMTLLENQVDVVTAADLLGHDPMMLTKEYTRSREDLKLAAVAKSFHTPLDTTHETAC